MPVQIVHLSWVRVISSKPQVLLMLGGALVTLKLILSIMDNRRFVMLIHSGETYVKS